MRTRRTTSIALMLSLALLGTGTGAQYGAAPGAPENIDIRTAKTAEASAFLESARAAVVPQRLTAVAVTQALGIARLQSSLSADVDLNPALGTPEIISTRAGSRFLTGPGPNRGATLRAFAAAYADALGVTGADVEALELVADYMNPAGNMGWAELEQRINGIPVFQGYLRGGFTAKGELVRTTGLLAPGLDASLLPTTPSVGAAQAVSLAATGVGWTVPESSLAQKYSEDNGNRVTFDRGSMDGDAKAWLLYFPLSPGTATLAWATEIWGDPDVFLTVVDASSGTVLFRKNLTNYQTQAVTYNVYTSDSPAPASPTPARPGDGYHAPFVPRVNVTLIGNEAPNTFNNLGWITDGNNTTDGNNVEAGVDRVAPNGVDAPVTGSALRVFNFAYDPATDSPLTPAYQNGDVTNMFYWTNRYHDATYLLGFTEAARNFQHDNFGRGGVGGDRVSAEGQDVSGTNNANFATPADGGRGRMQMFIWTAPTPDRSGDLDQDIIFHELTHGTSNRLHANATGLSSTMSGGMGEGWSDFYARALLSTADEDPNAVYALGGWATSALRGVDFESYYYGIRRFPHAVRSNVGTNGRPHNPLTFADIDPAQMDLSDGAFPPAFNNGAFQVHNIGEVWSSALFEVRARFITRLGWAEGNRRILQFVTDGMKLDPASPTLLQGRDAILAAAMASPTPDGQDLADIWTGFAVRGMGFSAQIVNAASGTVIEAFDMPGLGAAGGTLIGESVPNGGMDPGEFVTVSLCMTNHGVTVSGAATGTLLGTGGVTAPSIAQSFGTLAPGATACRPFSFTVSAACGGTVTATLQVAETGASSKSFTYAFNVGQIFGQNFDGVAAPALPAGWTTSTLSGTANLWLTQATNPDSAPNRVFAADPASISDNVLVSPAIAIPAGATRLTFRNSYATENTFDGGVLEIAIGAGAFQDIITAGGTFVSGGYNGTISGSFSSPIGGRQAWTGNSGGYITTAVTLPPAASGQNIRLRWRMATDISVASTGWAVDSVSIVTLVCGPVTLIAQPPQGLTVDSVAGSIVRLRWTPPAGGLTPTGYVLEGGVTPGDVLASIPTGSVDPVFTFAAPTGAFYVRVHTLSGAERSAPSNEVPLVVNVPVAPSAPANLLALVTGSTLNLSWKNTFGGGAPAGLILDVSGALSASLPIGLSETFGFAGVPGGTYTLSLRAQNGGGLSPSSNPVVVTFPTACSGAPQVPTNLLAHRVGSTGFVLWDPPAAGPAPTGYVLNVSGAFVGSFPTTARGLSAGVAPGTYNLSLVATNPCGTSAAASTVLVVP